MDCPDCGTELNQRHTPSINTKTMFWCECGFREEV